MQEMELVEQALEQARDLHKIDLVRALADMAPGVVRPAVAALTAATDDASPAVRKAVIEALSGPRLGTRVAAPVARPRPDANPAAAPEPNWGAARAPGVGVPSVRRVYLLRLDRPGSSLEEHDP